MLPCAIDTALCTLLCITLTTATLLVDYTAPAAVSDLGTPQLEGGALGDHLDVSAAIGSPAFIQPGKDPEGKAALHFHRDPGDRRAEVRAKGTYAAEKQYFVGYEFSLSNVHQHLALFQWYVVSNYLSKSEEEGDEDTMHLHENISVSLFNSLTRNQQEKARQVRRSKYPLQPPIHRGRANTVITRLHAWWWSLS